MIRSLFATTGRVLQQLLRDHRTLALLWLMPTILLVILRYMFDNQRAIFDSIGPMLLVIFPFVTMFLVTSVATLRERTRGTLERLLTTPMTKLSFILGYALAFGLMASVQIGLISWVAFGWLGLHMAGSEWLVFGVALLIALLGVALGLLTSAFARTEFQAVQFMPAFIFPQLLLCGLLVSRESMAQFLQWLSDIFPLTYAVEAIRELSIHNNVTAVLGKDMVILGSWVIGALVVASLTLRRKSS
jgi:ABC-2 type transport system permease protein